MNIELQWGNYLVNLSYECGNNWRIDTSKSNLFELITLSYVFLQMKPCTSSCFIIIHQWVWNHMLGIFVVWQKAGLFDDRISQFDTRTPFFLRVKEFLTLTSLPQQAIIRRRGSANQIVCKTSLHCSQVCTSNTIKEHMISFYLTFENQPTRNKKKV